jgi:pimeloyl-ACP methyl ester carboxylesterase
MRDIEIPVPGGQINVWHRPAQGESPTALLVHGLSGNSRWWGQVIEHFPEGFGVIALDVRGRAGSADAPAPYDLVTLADDITRCLDHFATDRAIVVGYSMGAWIAALFGRRHPERVERLVLVDGGFPLPVDEGADVEQIIDAVVGPSLARLELTFDSTEAFFDYWKRHPALEKHWDELMKPALAHELAEDNGSFVVRANAEAIQMSAREITVGEEANDAAAGLEVRTHLIVVERGTADQPGGMTPLHLAEEASRNIPDLTMEYLPGINHYTLVLGAGAPAVASAIAG